jgi:hypothetical protein
LPFFRGGEGFPEDGLTLHLRFLCFLFRPGRPRQNLPFIQAPRAGQRHERCCRREPNQPISHSRPHLDALA